ncbi:hypothetical protein HNQ91_000016 [Filimonas zeae]|uniref:Uncharacterized protein n=1 Tax=Filimonas zeae TaxID=1737353 RepID=A0A917MQ51_9BACT|nr:hypothetical protein [Filimonas zeae]MDR6336994.1 hypothetical protein [Filimonas zeae]GGH56498.1 hypothetical protein GCM10011379_00150 [Filimonas zeae]
MNKLYNTYCKLVGADNLFGNSKENAQFTEDPASSLIKEAITSGKPLMIARLGATELNAILNYHFVNTSLINNIGNIFRGIPYFMTYKKGVMENMNVLSGFFPSTKENLDRFAKMSLEDMGQIDILGSWLKQERFLFPFMSQDHARIRLWDLTPFKHENPWTEALAGKKVLIVHPFEDTIISQYKKREFLFKDPRVLPAFELKTVKAVQSAGDHDSGFKSWFEALDYMTDQISAKDFDIALLGCGAYGLPLAARIKRMGKQAIHIGGALQSLFGIKGARWERPPYNFHELYYNECWVRPNDADKPAGAQKIEGACYW